MQILRILDNVMFCIFTWLNTDNYIAHCKFFSPMGVKHFIRFSKTGWKIGSIFAALLVPHASLKQRLVIEPRCKIIPV